MSQLEKLLRAVSPPGTSGSRFGKQAMAGMSVAVVLLSALRVGPPAAADQMGSAKAEISAIRSQIASAADAVHALTLAYDQANVQADSLAQQVAADEAQLTQLRQKVSADQAALRQEALLSYTGETLPSVRPDVGSDPVVRAEYLTMAAQNMSDVIDRYRVEQDQLSTAAAGLVRQELASRAAADQVALTRAQAIGQAATEQAQLASLQTRLAQLQKEVQGPPVNNGMVIAVHAVVSPGGGAGGVWLELRQCESGNNYQADTGNGFYGAYQFSQQTWSNLGYPGRPDLESPAMQDEGAQRLQRQSGWGQWPACSAALGLR